MKPSTLAIHHDGNVHLPILIFYIDGVAEIFFRQLKVGFVATNLTECWQHCGKKKYDKSDFSHVVYFG